jgi:transposase
MARPCQIDKKMVTQAQRVVRQTRDADELRAAQAILLPSRGMTLEQTASFLGVSRATVPRLQARFRRWIGTEQSLYDGWGGRRRALLSHAAEKTFLKPWQQQAKSGTLVVVAPIREALAQQLGRPVAATVVYRLLARHGWRKLAPDTRHPRSSPARRAAWKKNSRRRWQPC